MTEGYLRADVYDALYSEMKNYPAEASWAAQLACRYIAGTPVMSELSLLDVACGTGLHLEHFAKWFQIVEGVDASEEQLSAARKRLPGINLQRGDMRNLVLPDDQWGERTYEVITCLFSAIGHMLTIADLYRAIFGMAEHLSSGGVLLVEPWLTPERWQPGRMSLESVDRPDFKVARVTRTTLEGNITTSEMHYTVGTPDAIDHYVENHQLALYTQSEYEDAFRRAGLEVTFDRWGISNNLRGVFIGVKPR